MNCLVQGPVFTAEYLAQAPAHRRREAATAEERATVAASWVQWVETHLGLLREQAARAAEAASVAREDARKLKQ